MKLAIDAVFRDGAFHPTSLEPLALADGQHVRLTVEEESPGGILALATRVYEGLSGNEIDEIEKIALDRRAFFREERSE